MGVASTLATPIRFVREAIIRMRTDINQSTAADPQMSRIVKQVQRGHKTLLELFPEAEPFIDLAYVANTQYGLDRAGAFMPPAEEDTRAHCAIFVSALLQPTLPSLSVFRWTVVGDDPAATAIHEDSHFIAWADSRTGSGRQQALATLERWLHRPVSPAIQTDRDAVRLIRSQVSVYASTSLDELIAECITMVALGNPSRLAREIAQPFLDRLGRDASGARAVFKEAIDRQVLDLYSYNGGRTAGWRSSTPADGSSVEYGKFFVRTEDSLLRIEDGVAYERATNRRGVLIEREIGRIDTVLIGQPLVMGTPALRTFLPSRDEWPVKAISTPVVEMFTAGIEISEAQAEQMGLANRATSGMPDVMEAYMRPLLESALGVLPECDVRLTKNILGSTALMLERPGDEVDLDLLIATAGTGSVYVLDFAGNPHQIAVTTVTGSIKTGKSSQEFSLARQRTTHDENLRIGPEQQRIRIGENRYIYLDGVKRIEIRAPRLDTLPTELTDPYDAGMAQVANPYRFRSFENDDLSAGNRLATTPIAERARDAFTIDITQISRGEMGL